ncbi:MAG: ATP-binding cassette domain-containing protein [Bacilli bacterium]|nr:ATP-binding cassette domain-containing protein [Bacilli bacterium]
MNKGLKLKNLYFKDILTDINFELKPGTINALIGKNGSGKTLVLKCIVGFIKYSGLISLNDVVFDEKNIGEQIKNIGIYLNTKKLEDKNVYSNLIDPLFNLNYQEETAKKKVYEIAKKLDISDLLYKEIETLSHSQKKVVSFAQSIIHSPNLILIDNLFDSLDKHYKEKIISFLKSIKKTKKTIILFTANNSEDLFLADNLLIIKSGKIIEMGEPKKLLENESLFIKNDVDIPFISDLSNKMIAYELINKPIYDMNEMVEEIWQ